MTIRTREIETVKFYLLLCNDMEHREPYRVTKKEQKFITWRLESNCSVMAVFGSRVFTIIVTQRFSRPIRYKLRLTPLLMNYLPFFNLF